MANSLKQYIALGSRLKGIPEVLTLGVKPDFTDYTPEQRRLILDADMILYPTTHYAQFFTTMGKKIFPSLETELYACDKIKQTNLFNMLNIPHPKTKIYYPSRFQNIVKDFSFPFVAKVPRNSSQGRGVFKIDNQIDLNAYLQSARIAYIQQFLPHDQDLRVVLIHYEPIIAYWRIRTHNNFKTNLYQGGKISFKDIPQQGIEAAQNAAKKCKFNDVGLDLIYSQKKWHVIEANMKYGRKGIKKAGTELKYLIWQKIVD